MTLVSILKLETPREPKDSYKKQQTDCPAGSPDTVSEYPPSKRKWSSSLAAAHKQSSP